MKLLTAALFAAALLGLSAPLRGQQMDLSKPPPPPPPEEPAFDPYHAEKSIEIGTFYFKKGDYDAAIDRFEEATHFQPSLAKPWKLMGEAYEKKHAYESAIASYRKYLEVLPGAEDAAKVKKRIAGLEQKISRAAAKSSPK